MSRCGNQSVEESCQKSWLDGQEDRNRGEDLRERKLYGHVWLLSMPENYDNVFGINILHSRGSALYCDQ